MDTSIAVERRGRAVTASFPQGTPLDFASSAMHRGLSRFASADRKARVKVAPRRALTTQRPFFVLGCDDEELAATLRECVESAVREDA